MITNLTKPLSKRLLFAMLVITIGAEVLLYLSRYTYLASNLYDAMMVSSFFVGLKLHRRIHVSENPPITKRQLMLKFTGAMLFFLIGSTIINIFSANTFQDFSKDYDQYVQGYTDIQTIDDPDAGAVTEAPIWSFFEKVDTIGYDIYTDSLAGLEEVWRLAYIILLLVIFKKIFPNRWETGKRDLLLMSALFITSILFGIDHTLDSAQAWTIRIGAIVTFANMGLLFGIILLWTRNLWLTVIVHAAYDISASLSWYYFDYAVELFMLLIAAVHLILYIIEKAAQRRIRRQVETMEQLQAAE